MLGWIPKLGFEGGAWQLGLPHHRRPFLVSARSARGRLTIGGEVAKCPRIILWSTVAVQSARASASAVRPRTDPASCRSRCGFARCTTHWGVP